jgi:hypothetical protein
VTFWRIALDEETIGALSPNHISGYLLSRGCIDQGPFGPTGRLYRIVTASSDQEVVLPIRRSIVDFTRRMAELVQTLSIVERRDQALVVFDLACTSFDVIRVRSKDADHYGSIRFDEGIQLHEEAKNLLLAVARATASEHPRKAWKGRRPESVAEYLHRVRLGQTEKQSFSITILSPYNFEPNAHPSLFPGETFGRRVTLQLGRALRAVETALAEAVTDVRRAFDRSISSGVSAELCGSLAKLADNDEGVELSVSWSPAKPATVEPVRLLLSRSDAAILQDVSRDFANEEPEPNARIEGLVTQIGEDPRTYDGSSLVEAVLDGRLRKVNIFWGQSERETLIKAFEQRRRIQVEGELVSENKRLRLQNPRNLVVINDSDMG